MVFRRPPPLTGKHVEERIKFIANGLRSYAPDVVTDVTGFLRITTKPAASR